MLRNIITCEERAATIIILFAIPFPLSSFSGGFMKPRKLHMYTKEKELMGGLLTISLWLLKKE